MSDRKPPRIMIPIGNWTPVCREVFDEVLPFLKSTLGQVIYLMLYDRIWHNGRGFVCASVQDLARWTDADWRTVKRALRELRHKGFVERSSTGRAKSRSHKPRWHVPMSDFDMKTDGPWTAVPRFLIKEYPRSYRNSVLVPLILWHQSYKGKNECLAGVDRLAEFTGWSKRKVFHALHTMAHKSKWKRLGLDLPRPLAISYNWVRNRRHFRVRAVFYEPRPTHGWPRMWVTQEFAEHFQISRWHDASKPRLKTVN